MYLRFNHRKPCFIHKKIKRERERKMGKKKSAFQYAFHSIVVQYVTFNQFKIINTKTLEIININVSYS